MEAEKIRIILNQISEVVNKHEKILEESGEKFNVFNILGLSTNEVRTHSSFLSELLNPKGSHYQNDVFLKLFLEQLNIIDFDTKYARVEVEKYVGFISDDKTEGGNIDIIITNPNNQAIIIENKIYAGDQVNQILRYFNYGKKQHSVKFNLFYLTLTGKEASEYSSKTLTNKDYHVISYETHILNWLIACKAVAKNSIIKETIAQYIVLIKQLTHQSINGIMKQELNKILKENPEFIKNLPLINSEVESIKTESIEKLIANLNERINIENPILSKADITYLIKIVNDNDGFQFCFYGAKDNVQIDFDEKPIDFLVNKRIELSKIFKISGAPICWKNFNHYPIELEKLHAYQIIEMGTLIVENELLSEMKDYIEQFKDIMNK